MIQWVIQGTGIIGSVQRSICWANRKGFSKYWFYQFFIWQRWMVVHPKWRWEISCQLIDFILLLKIIGTTSRRVIIEISRWELWIAHEITPDCCLPFVLINMFSVIFWRQQSLTRKFPFPNKVKKWKTLPSYDFCYWWCKLWFRIFLSGTCGTCCCYCRIADL